MLKGIGSVKDFPRRGRPRLDGCRSWLVAYLVRLRLRVRPWPKSVDFHDAENRQRPCRMNMRFLASRHVDVCNLSMIANLSIVSWLKGQQLTRQNRHAPSRLQITNHDLKVFDLQNILLEKCEEWKRHLTPAGLLKLVKRFEETRKLEDRARAGRPCLKEARGPCIAVEMEAIASEAASETSSAREAARRLAPVRNILRRLLQLYPYKLQSCHEPADTAQRKHLRNGPSLKWNKIPPGFLTSCGEMKLISRFMVTLTTITVAFERLLINVRPFFETQCPVNGWITETVIAHRYLTLLRETVVPCLIQRGQISNVTFMQDAVTSHTANPVKTFLIQTFGEDRIVSRHCRYPWPPRSPDLTPADFWLWGYLKSRVYLSGPSSLPELKDAIHREVSSIHPDMLHSAVAGFVTRLECLLPCGGGHVEHILV
ncbi:uncharacterized protein TNCV_1366911 [Trichonephila clavipes]|nr:uncharacterized protein TNCV_1366911 [Trichonephila clavipes]